MQSQHETQVTYQRAAFVARESYGRLVAYLATRWGDLAAAEDALSAAFVAALERWPTQGVPKRPESWLLTVGVAGGQARHHRAARRPGRRDRGPRAHADRLRGGGAGACGPRQGLMWRAPPHASRTTLTYLSGHVLCPLN
jgi:hypothetical protein